MKIKDFVKVDEKSIEKINFANKTLLETEVGILTEYMQYAKNSGDVIFFKAKENQDSASIIDKYCTADLEQIIFVTNVALPNNLNYIVGDLDKLKVSMTNSLYPIDESFLFYGVTGTNGKTSIVNMTSMILAKNDINLLAMGTVGLRKGSELLVEGSLNSSPPYVDFKRMIYENREGAIGVFVEVTSHALTQDRFMDIRFDEIFWTNFSQDHLDFHKTENEYFNSKFKIFEYAKKEMIHLHSSEVSLADRIKEKIESEKETRKDKKDFKIKYANPILVQQFKGKPLSGFIEKNFTLALNAVSFILRDMGKKRVKLKLGKWNEYLPEGRFQIVEDRERTFIIDYAHTPDALEKLLIEAKEIFPDKDRVIIFGCGGNRDRSKRPQMGLVARNNSEKIIVTSDNPRDESPQSIINDIIQVFEETIDFNVSREAAIKKGVELATAENVVIIAGKGHEDYQEIKGEKLPFKDIEILRKYL